MSRENAEIVRSLFEAFNRGDIEAGGKLIGPIIKDEATGGLDLVVTNTDGNDERCFRDLAGQGAADAQWRRKEPGSR